MIQFHNVDLSFGVTPILKNISVEITDKQIIGLIGVNGAGKSSFMKIINGDLEIDWGSIYTKGATSVAYLSQDPLIDITKWKHSPILKWYVKRQQKGAGTTNTNLQDQHSDSFDLATMLKIDLTSKLDTVVTVDDLISNQKLYLIQQYKHFGYSDKELVSLENQFEAKIYTNFRLFQLDVGIKNQTIDHLSGGQLRKLGLSLVFSVEPNILLLDEPTNHLDLESIMILESHIKTIKNTSLIFVSHDRYFTDAIAGVMWEVVDGSVKTHKGNYSQFLKDKAHQSHQLKTETWKKKQYLKRELEWVQSGVKARGTKDKGRLERYTEDKKQLSTLQSKSGSKLSILLPHMPRLGSKIIEIDNSSCTVGGKKLWENLYISVQKNHKIGVLGKNGTGKSTLLKYILGALSSSLYHTTGKIRVGENTIFLTYDQHKTIDDDSINAFEYIAHGREYISYHTKQGIKQISSRHYLSLWLFDKEKYMMPIKFLSGGERSRLLLAKQFLKPANVLILDEPTNDLDLETMMVLEQALRDFEGVVIVISHDRSFLDKVCNQMWFFDSYTPHLYIVDGNYSTITQYFDPTTFTKIKELESDSNRQNTKTQKITKEERQFKKEVLRIETQISKQEEIVLELQKRFENPELFTNLERVAKLKGHLEREEKTLEDLLEKWELLHKYNE